jgi:hypothetical protein
MVPIVLLITFLVGYVLILWWRGTFWHVAALRVPKGGILRDSAFGLSELKLPTGWRPAKIFAGSDCLQAIDPFRGRSVIVVSESRDDFVAAMNLEEHSARHRKLMGASMRIVGLRGPDRREVAGFPALQYEMDAVDDFSVFTYLHTTIAGRRAFHLVVGWASRSRYDRAVFERILDGFSEVPGPEPNPLATTEESHVLPASNYDVH